MRADKLKLIIGFLLLLVIMVGIGVGVLLVSQSQDNRQLASGNCFGFIPTDKVPSISAKIYETSVEFCAPNGGVFDFKQKVNTKLAPLSVKSDPLDSWSKVFEPGEIVRYSNLCVAPVPARDLPLILDMAINVNLGGKEPHEGWGHVYECDGDATAGAIDPEESTALPDRPSTAQNMMPLLVEDLLVETDATELQKTAQENTVVENEEFFETLQSNETSVEETSTTETTSTQEDSTNDTLLALANTQEETNFIVTPEPTFEPTQEPTPTPESNLLALAQTDASQETVTTQEEFSGTTTSTDSQVDRSLDPSNAPVTGASDYTIALLIGAFLCLGLAGVWMLHPLRIETEE